MLVLCSNGLSSEKILTYTKDKVAFCKTAALVVTADNYEVTVQRICVGLKELTKIVQCVKYYSYREFDTWENYGTAIKVFFENYMKELQRLLIAPFDISLGYSLQFDFCE